MASTVDLLDALSAGEWDLNGLALEPDGRYQTQARTLGDMDESVIRTLAKEFQTHPEPDFPLLVVGWGKCRTGSTALTNLFGLNGVAAYYQPVKTIARHELLGQPGDPWPVPGDRVVFAKEMAGPYVIYETVFNPIDLLVRAGWPADRLHLLVLNREPLACLSSWQNKWSDRIGRDRVLQNFLISDANYERVQSGAKQLGVPVTNYVYEATRHPEVAVPALFSRLGISDSYHAESLSNWGSRGNLNSEQAAVRYPREPEPYVVANLHSAGDSYMFVGRDAADLAEAEVAAIHEHAVVDNYTRSVERCRADLALPEAMIPVPDAR